MLSVLLSTAKIVSKKARGAGLEKLKSHLLALNQDNAEAEVVGGEARAVEDAESRAAAGGVNAPASAPDNTFISFFSAMRVCGRISVPILPPIQTPLIHVAMHIVQSPGVRKIRTDGGMIVIGAAIIIITSYFIHFWAIRFIR